MQQNIRVSDNLVIHVVRSRNGGTLISLLDRSTGDEVNIAFEDISELMKALLYLVVELKRAVKSEGINE